MQRQPAPKRPFKPHDVKKSQCLLLDVIAALCVLGGNKSLLHRIARPLHRIERKQGLLRNELNFLSRQFVVLALVVPQRFAVFEHISAAWRNRSAQDVGDCRFALTALAYKPHFFAVSYLKGYVRERNGGGLRFALSDGESL